jgi:hypothetical protein
MHRLVRLAVTVLLVDVLTEAWSDALFGYGWIKTVKSALYLLVLGLTVIAARPHRRWREFTRPADLALIVLIGGLLVSAACGAVSPTIAGLGSFVYVRGVIVFYAVRALPANDRWATLLAGLALGWAALNSVVALIQVAVGPLAYTALGWQDLEMARIHRAQGLFGHPNDLGQFLGLTIIGLGAWMISRYRNYPLWMLLALLGLGLAATESRESLIGLAVGLVVLAALARLPRRAFYAALVALGLLAAIPALAVPGVRSEVSRRAAGLGVSLGLPVPSPPVDLSLPICGPPPPVHTAAGSACRHVGGDEEIRVVFAREAVPLWLARPLIGYGPGTFGGVVALQTDPSWNRNPRLGPAGFDLRGFSGKTIDSFWLHLLIELGTVGLVAYLLWLWLLVRPLLSARGDPFVQCGIASVAFVTVIGVFSLSPEGPIVPALLFAALGFAWKREVAGFGSDRGSFRQSVRSRRSSEDPVRAPSRVS